MGCVTKLVRFVKKTLTSFLAFDCGSKNVDVFIFREPIMPNWHPTSVAFSAHSPSSYFSGTWCFFAPSSIFTSWSRRSSRPASPSSCGSFSTESSTIKPGVRYFVCLDLKDPSSTSLTRLKLTNCLRKNLWIEVERPKVRKVREVTICPSLWGCHFTGYLNNSSNSNKFLPRTTLSPSMTFHPLRSELLKRPDQDQLQEQVFQEDQVKALST